MDVADIDELQLSESRAMEADSGLYRFYEKLSELSSTWIMLEDQHYRNTKMGDLEFGVIDAFKDWPQLSYFNCTQARNGGPIGKSNLMLVSRFNLTFASRLLDEGPHPACRSKDAQEPSIPLRRLWHVLQDSECKWKRMLEERINALLS